jgi:hypothetical protein
VFGGVGLRGPALGGSWGIGPIIPQTVVPVRVF